MSYDNASPSALLTRSTGVGHIYMCWTKIVAYPGSGFWTTFFGVANGDDVFVGSNDGSIPLTSVAFSAPSGDQLIESGASTSWFFNCIIADDTVGFDYQVFWRAEGQATLNNTNLGSSSAGGMAALYLMNNPPTSNNNHNRISAYKEWTNYNSLGTGATLLANILAESQQNAPIITAGNCNYLSCAVGSTIGQDTSAAGNDWVVVPTITTNADEPIMTIGSPSDALFFGAGTTS